MMTLNKDTKLHLSHYLVLLFILGLSTGSFLLFKDKFDEIIILVTTSVIYLLWGIIHHWLADDLHPKVILEYLLVAVLINIVVISLLLWS